MAPGLVVFEEAGRQTLADLTFLCGLVGVVALLTIFPTGRFEIGWHRYVVLAFFALASIGPLWLSLTDGRSPSSRASRRGWSSAQRCW